MKNATAFTWICHYHWEKTETNKMDFLKNSFPYNSDLYRQLRLLKCFEQLGGLVYLSRYIAFKEIMKFMIRESFTTPTIIKKIFHW